MGIFGRKRVKKIKEKKFPIPVDVQDIKPPTQMPQISELPKFGPEFEQPKVSRPVFPPQPKPAPISYPTPTQVPNVPPQMPPKQPEVAAQPEITPPPERKSERAPTFAPLFIKLTRYRQILNSLNYLKMSINLIRNQLAILNELERLRSENMKLLQSTMEKIHSRLIKLDSEFMRPSGFMEDVPEMQMHELESLEGTITDLRAQIEGLKEEVDSLA